MSVPKSIFFSGWVRRRFSLDSEEERRHTFGAVPEKSKIDLQSVVVVTKQQLASSIGGETVILGLETGRYYGVDSVGARVWQIIQEPSRVADIRDAIVAEYDVDPGVCETDLLALLGQMAAGKLIEVQAERNS
jgi:hypothetical protein